MDKQKVARALGWFGVGLGLTQLFAPRLFTRTLGAPDRPGLVRTAYGLRDIASGVGILARSNPSPFLWARVAGDAMDLVTLNRVNSVTNPRRGNVKAALASVAAVTALDLLTAKAMSNKPAPRRWFGFRRA